MEILLRDLLHAKGFEDGSNWASAIIFDLGFSASGTDKLYATSEYKSGSESFKQMISINIKESEFLTISQHQKLVLAKRELQ